MSVVPTKSSRIVSTPHCGRAGVVDEGLTVAALAVGVEVHLRVAVLLHGRRRH
ncbi:hypothetical protein [Curtobacterium sp. VKM Ac-1395]|uniref:hypothetical protein n=1 Tax=Curtobacterium sp. VKM Ac-1395 TaxID=2783815 RepID=UPI00188C7327|nr:hypothetical protein [Curtobacterium sp. VKM Ac-1395]MBF4589533.1 hypothetical protein [Curtobacterium sp. VKM Ac-1395]